MVFQHSLFDPPLPEIPNRHGRATISIREKTKALNKANGSIGDFDYSLNPYVGCAFGCTYCFATAYVADDERREAWGTWVDVKIEAEKQIAKADLEGKKIFMSSATDPYQPVEAKIELTRRIVEILATKQPYLVVQTRSPLVTRDIDLFLKFKKIRINMSITTDSETVRKRFEPSCASIDRRIEALTECSRAGLETAICISPMLPIENPSAFAKRLREIRATRCYCSYFHSSDRKFVSTTRDLALVVAEEYGWTEKEFRLTRAAIAKDLPELSI